jgi:hypothetical protein
MLGLVMESPGGSRTWRFVPRQLTAEDDGGVGMRRPCLVSSEMWWLVRTSTGCQGCGAPRQMGGGVDGRAARDGWRRRWARGVGWVGGLAGNDGGAVRDAGTAGSRVRGGFH